MNRIPPADSDGYIMALRHANKGDPSELVGKSPDDQTVAGDCPGNANPAVWTGPLDSGGAQFAELERDIYMR